MVCGRTWSAHTIHIKYIGGFGTTTCDARSTHRPTNQPNQPVETCLPVLQSHLSSQAQLLPVGGTLPSAIKNKGLAVVLRGFGVKRHRHGSCVDPGCEICIPTRTTIRMYHADVMVASQHHWRTCPWRWVDPKQRSSVGAVSTIVSDWLAKAHLSPPRKRLIPDPLVLRLSGAVHAASFSRRLGICGLRLRSI